MSLSTTIVESLPGRLEDAKKYLAEFSEIEIYGENPKMNKLLLVIDAGDERIIKISEEIQKHDCILDVLSHSVFYENTHKEN